jgi:hypothetical protein
MRRLACIALLASSCAVDLGSTSTVACAPSPDYFVSEIAPGYLDANRCGSAGCHAFADGHGSLRLRDVSGDVAPAPQTPLAMWPLSWRENYLSTIHVVRCDAPAASRLLTVPEGSGNLHPPGPVVLDRQSAQQLVQQWVAMP